MVLDALFEKKLCVLLWRLPLPLFQCSEAAEVLVLWCLTFQRTLVEEGGKGFVALMDVQILVVCLVALTLEAFVDVQNFEAVGDEKVSVSLSSFRQERLG